MKKGLFLILFSFFFLAFSHQTHAQSKESVKQQKFVSEFVGALSVQKKNKIIQKIDKKYRKEFLKKKHKGNKEAFLAEFLTGYVEKNGEYSKVPLEKVMDARLIEIDELRKGVSACRIVLSTSEGPVNLILILFSRGKKENKYSFQPTQKND